MKQPNGLDVHTLVCVVMTDGLMLIYGERSVMDISMKTLSRIRKRFWNIYNTLQDQATSNMDK